MGEISKCFTLFPQTPPTYTTLIASKGLYAPVYDPCTSRGACDDSRFSECPQTQTRIWADKLSISSSLKKIIGTGTATHSRWSSDESAEIASSPKTATGLDTVTAGLILSCLCACRAHTHAGTHTLSPFLSLPLRWYWLQRFLVGSSCHVVIKNVSRVPSFASFPKRRQEENRCILQKTCKQTH